LSSHETAEPGTGIGDNPLMGHNRPPPDPRGSRTIELALILGAASQASDPMPSWAREGLSDLANSGKNLGQFQPEMVLMPASWLG